MSIRYDDDPRDWCESDGELAREVLDPEELAEYLEQRGMWRRGRLSPTKEVIR